MVLLVHSFLYDAFLECYSAFLIHTVRIALWPLGVYYKVRKLKLVFPRINCILHVCISIIR